jgi:hypothetical protein
MLYCDMHRIQPLHPEDRSRLAEKVMEWGNLVFTGLVVGQFVPGTEQIRPGILTTGIMAIIGAYTVAFWLMQRRRGGDTK